MGLLEKEWFIKAPWGKICIVAWGECSSPPVLLCHGAIDSAATFRPLLNLLPRDFYYIAVELPGNGKSDHYLPGMMVSVYDLVYVITVVVRHFRWEKFRFIGHSMGTAIGLFYQLSYPGMLTQLINLDPVSSRIATPADQFDRWCPGAAVITHDQAISKLMRYRGLSKETAAEILDRISETTDDGKIRYTFDQRMKLVTRPPISPENLKRICTGMKTPTLSIIAEDSVKNGRYSSTPFVFDESEYPAGNYRVRRVEGGHDVHLTNPERLAGYVAQFLLYGPEGLDSKSKL
ncbi:unnamed protein product [Diatraea saccharalis]|uniref:AB hydrolase-1 domain-containing protein n=1 Tax=Diatraea saccharalis TaxID=40085 RepID=A0A9N9R455_9NEOP|nr:unnamed protein product [Diatraea saccharalis]